jgi:hypothetical protein
LAVHWAPSVYIWTPGVMAALAAGAQVGAAVLEAVVPTRVVPSAMAVPNASVVSFFRGVM